jgi:hypothetical protein
MGVDVQGFSPPVLLAARFLVDVLFPLVLLLVVSYLTPRDNSKRVLIFYGRLKTPVGATEEEEKAALLATIENPARFDKNKLFPNSDWEFTKWDKTDALGFTVCCLFVVIILLVFKGLMLIGA